MTTDLFKPAELRKGFAAPKKSVPRGRRNPLVVILAALILVGVWIHKIEVIDSDKNWFSGFGSDDEELGTNAASSPAAQTRVKHSPAGNETNELLDHLKQHNVSLCNTAETKKIRILGLPSTTPGSPVRLQSGVIHTISIVSLDEKDEQLCEGGDYYETDLSGERWKSRPPLRDLQNGTYEIVLQVDEEFVGLYEFKVFLLFSRFHGLELLEGPSSTFRGEEVAAFQLLFEAPEHHSPREGSLPRPSLCTDGDYNLTTWSGRWTRSHKNESCVMDTGGRYQCLPPSTPCELPWCEGPLNKVDSNGWVYSAHCRFKLFTPDEAWSCLDKKWLFSWSDSTSEHTWQNLLAFIMDYADIIDTEVPRRMDRDWIRPEINGNKSQGLSQSFRLTMVYNGHAEEEGQFQGLASLNVPYFREYLRAFFVNPGDPTYTSRHSSHELWTARCFSL